MSEHSPGSGQVLMLAEIGKQFLAVVGGGRADPAAAGPVTDEDTAMAYIKQLVANSENLIKFNTHETHVFPETTEFICTLAGHASANTWTGWGEIVDNQGTPVTLSSKFTSHQGHIAAMLVETADTSGAIYMAEIAYGGAKKIISRHRILTETSKHPTAQVARERGVHIPSGQTIYYRGMCNNAGSKTVQVQFRYFLHSA